MTQSGHQRLRTQNQALPECRCELVRCPVAGGDNIQMLDTSIFLDQMTVRRLRLGAGLIMLCYLTLHLCMHALGNVSFEAMQWGTQIHDFIWHSVPGTIALYGALAI